MYTVQVNNDGEVTNFEFWDYGDAVDFAFERYDDNPYHHVVINCD